MKRAQPDSYYEIASSQLDKRGAAEVELGKSVMAINAAFADWQAGDIGIPARTALRETCERLGLVIDE